MNILRALIAAAVSVVALAAPASAGGPTSAILSVPGEGKTASLYYTDEEYAALARLIGAEGLGVPGSTDDSGQSHESGAGVTVTWLIHDVEPWRVDRIYPNAEGGPWVATQVTDSETGSIWDSPVVWHQPTSGKELSMLLDQLLEGKAAAPAPSVPDTEPPAAAPAAAPAASAATVSGAWWALGGLAGGVLLTLGFVRLRAGRESDTAELDPGADWLAPQTRSTSA